MYSTSTRASSDAILSELQEEEKRKTAQLTASCLKETKGGFRFLAAELQAGEDPVSM